MRKSLTGSITGMVTQYQIPSNKYMLFGGADPAQVLLKALEQDAGSDDDGPRLCSEISHT